MFDSPVNVVFMVASFVMALLFCMAVLTIVFFVNLVFNKQFKKSQEVMKSWKNNKTWSDNSYLVDMEKVKTNNKVPNAVFLCVDKDAKVLYITLALIGSEVLDVGGDIEKFTLSCGGVISKDTFHEKIHKFGSKTLKQYGISVLASKSNNSTGSTETIETTEEDESISFSSQLVT